ncbi:hypothetical protein [Syntrophomonas zehnderi]|nr:hypothetical protein [Syntrophomonas zehnderi]
MKIANVMRIGKLCLPAEAKASATAALPKASILIIRFLSIFDDAANSV